MASKGMLLALLSGLLSAVASLLGKLSAASEEARSFCRFTAINLIDKTELEAHYLCESALTIVRGCLFISMIACNTLMWTVFTKALRASSATLEVTVVNLAANFFSSAIFGQTLFSEKLSLLWYTGSVMIIVGLCLMHYGNKLSEEQRSEKAKDRSHWNTDKRYPPGLRRNSTTAKVDQIIDKISKKQQ